MARRAENFVLLTGTAGEEVALTVGSNPVGMSASVRLANQSTFVLQWRWGDNSGYIQPSMMDVLFPGAQAGDVNITALLSLVDVSTLPPSTFKGFFYEFAFDDKFPGLYPQVMVPFSIVVVAGGP